MKVKVVGSEKEGYVIRGKERIGQELVIGHEGKVKIGMVVRTKRYTKTMVRYAGVTVLLKGSKQRIKGPIAKGLPEEVKVLGSRQI